MTGPTPHAMVADAELAHRVAAGDAAARTVFVERYLSLARTLAFRYRRTAEPLDDLLQVASLGLVKAVDRWDPGRGVAFSSFAVPTILGELRRHFRNTTWCVRPPRGLQELCVNVEKSREALRAATGREPGVAELALRLGREVVEIEEAVQAMRGRHGESFDAPIDPGDGEGEVGEHVGADDAGYREVEARLTAEALVTHLDRRMRLVLRLRFHEDMTQSEIAARLGVSQMHVSRILRTALDQLALRHEASARAA